MKNNRLSYEQETLYNIFQSVGCMTYVQAKMILTKFLRCSENQADYIIHLFIKMRVIESTSENEHGFLICGNRENHTSSGTDRDHVKALYYLIDHAESIEDILSAFNTSTPDVTLTFVLNGLCYEAIPLDGESIYKANVAKRRYVSELSQLDIEKLGDNFSPFITVFMFKASDDEKEVLEKMAALNLSMPHSVVFFKSSNVLEWMEYEEYEIQ